MGESGEIWNVKLELLNYHVALAYNEDKCS